MIHEHEAVTRAAALAETADADTREALTGLLSAYRKLRSAYAYLEAEGRPEAHPIDQPAPADSLEALADGWRAEAETLRAAGADALASLSERHAGELEAADAARTLDTVTLEEASEVGGYSYSHLQHLLADGKIPNAGSKGAPRIYRRDIPRKPGHGSHRPTRTRLELIEASLPEVADG